jgi:hypothetical protein
MGVVRLLGKQQPDKQYRLTSITETAAQATEAKGEKGKIAKQIVLGIDGHLNSYQVYREVLAASSRCRASVWRSFCSSPASSCSWQKRVYPVYEAGPLG